VLVMTVAVGSTLTVATFGVAILLTGSHSRPVGVFLLIMAASMSIMVVTMIVRGHLGPRLAEYRRQWARCDVAGVYRYRASNRRCPAWNVGLDR
jgi:hypothetical protein